MNRRIAAIVALVLLVIGAFGLREKGQQSVEGFDLQTLARLPCLHEGRIQPLGAVARNAWKRIQGYWPLPDPHRLDGEEIEWLAQTLFGGREDANRLPIFKIENPRLREFLMRRREVEQRVGWRLLVFGPSADARRYSYRELSLQLPRIKQQSEQSAKIAPPRRSAFDIAILELRDSMRLYEGLLGSFRLDGGNRRAEIRRLLELLPAGQAAAANRRSGRSFDSSAFERTMEKWYAYGALRDTAALYPIPRKDASNGWEWESFPAVIDRIAQSGHALELDELYVRLADSFSGGDSEDFNKVVAEMEILFRENHPEIWSRAQFELAHEKWRFPWTALAAFAVSLAFVILYWARSKPEWLSFSYSMSLGGLVVLSCELYGWSRIAQAAPIFGLYAASTLIAWSAIFFGLLLQRKHWNGLTLFGSNSIALIFVAVAILSETREPAIAPLAVDVAGNGWIWGQAAFLSLGFACSLLAGAIGILYFVIGIFTRRMSVSSEDRFGLISYRLIALSTGLIAMGIIFGGLWSQEARGVFWRWDAHENAMLMVALWNAAMLHARWGGFTQPRRFLSMAIVSTLLSAFSLLGVSALATGSRAFEFGSGSLRVFLLFALFGGVGLLLSAIPLSKWRSALPNSAQR